MRVTELNSKLNSPFSASELMWSVVCQCNERIECGRSRIEYRRQYIKLRNFLATRYRLVAQSIKLSGHRHLLLALIILDRTTVWKKNMHSANSSMNPTGRQELLRGTFCWDRPNSGPIFSTVLVPQLQL